MDIQNFKSQVLKFEATLTDTETNMTTMVTLVVQKEHLKAMTKAAGPEGWKSDLAINVAKCVGKLLDGLTPDMRVIAPVEEKQDECDEQK